MGEIVEIDNELRRGERGSQGFILVFRILVKGFLGVGVGGA